MLILEPGVIFPSIRELGPEQEIVEVLAGGAVTRIGRPDLGPASGAHADLPEAKMLPAVEAFRVAPANPQHEILGVPTARLRFEDEAERQGELIAAGLARWEEDPS